MSLSFHAWPPGGVRGQHVRAHTGVLCLDEETGVAVYVCSERSQRGNQELARQRVELILEKVVTW